MGSGTGSDTPRNGGVPVTDGDRFIAELIKRAAWVVVAAGLGAGGGVGYIKTQPDARADPWTGTQGRALTERVRELEHSQALDDDHRVASVGGYVRIREVETRCAECMVLIHALESRVRALEQTRDFYHGGGK